MRVKKMMAEAVRFTTIVFALVAVVVIANWPNDSLYIVHRGNIDIECKNINYHDNRYVSAIHTDGLQEFISIAAIDSVTVVKETKSDKIRRLHFIIYTKPTKDVY